MRKPIEHIRGCNKPRCRGNCEVLANPVKRWIIKRLMQTCTACPAQWEGWIEDGRMIYIRFRWGYLSVSISEKPTEDVNYAVGGKEIFGRQLSDGLDSYIDIDKLIKETAEVLEFPKKEVI